MNAVIFCHTFEFNISFPLLQTEVTEMVDIGNARKKSPIFTTFCYIYANLHCEPIPDVLDLELGIMFHYGRRYLFCN